MGSDKPKSDGLIIFIAVSNHHSSWSMHKGSYADGAVMDDWVVKQHILPLVHKRVIVPWYAPVAKMIERNVSSSLFQQQSQ